MWGAFAGAPVSLAPGAFILGEVIPGSGPQRLNATDSAKRVAAAGTPPAFDGFHFAASAVKLLVSLGVWMRAGLG